MGETMIIKARYVVTMVDELIVDGAVAFDGGRIIDVGTGDEVTRKHQDVKVIDLGNRIVMPALVNAHSHVAITDAAGLIESKEFLDWLVDLMPWMRSRTPDEFMRSSINGLNGMLKAGITTIGDSFFAPEPMIAALKMGFRGIFFHEVFGVSAVFQFAAIGKYTRELMARMDLEYDNCHLGISPHAPYTVTPSVLRFVKKFSAADKMRISMHVAETLDELEFLRSSTGKFRRQFTPIGRRIPTTNLSPLEYIDSFGIVNDRFLAIHGVHLTESEFGLLASRGGHLVTCPSSNRNLKTGRLDLRKPLNAGVNACVGTDSPASSDGIDLFNELRLALGIGESDEIRMNPRDALAMITKNPAKALGFEKEIGTIEAGKSTDLIALDIRGESSGLINIEDSIVRNTNADDVALAVSSGIVKYSRVPEMKMQSVL